MQALARSVTSGALASAWRGNASSLQLLARHFAQDTHDDFKPQYKVDSSNDTSAQIQKWISENKVFIFMKGAPTAPQCGFSRMACAVLNAHGVQYGSANVLADNAIREGIKKFTSWPTIPQVFIDGEFVGGADIMLKMHESGELDKLLGPVVKEQQAAKK